MNHWPLTGIVVGLEWLVPAGVCLWLLRTNHQGTPLSFKQAMTAVFSLLTFGIFICILASLGRMTRRIHFVDGVAVTLWFGQVVIWTWLWRYARVKSRAQKKSAAGSGQNDSGFFWQGTLILLPVGVMAVIGLVSLRQDRLMAEQDAREGGAALAQQAARALRGELELQLRDYYNANFTLQANRQAIFGLTHWAPGTDLVKVNKDIEDWQQAHPDVELAHMPVTQVTTDLAGEITNGVYVPDYSPAPKPAPWLAGLTGEQMRLWRQVEKAEYANNAVEAAQSAVDAFLATDPPKGAQANAQFILLQLRAKRLPPDQAFDLLATSRWARSSELTESGLGVGDLIRYEALRRASNGTLLPSNFITIVASSAYRDGSVLSPRLVDELDRVTRSGPNPSPGIESLRALLNAAGAARRLAEDFRQQCPSALWSNGFFWATSVDGEFLLNLAQFDGKNVTEFSPRGVHVTNVPPSWSLQIFPKSIVVHAWSNGLAKADLAIPAYAKATIDIGGREFDAERGTPLQKSDTAGWPVLGDAAGMIDVMPNPTNAYQFAFHARVLLAEPATLYAHQGQRSLLFGGLILVSTIAALIGFLAARRSFYRQLQLNELKSDFVSSVSHELRAPIASVRLMAEGLERGRVTGPEKQREYFGFIVQECRRLSSLIENVLDFSRIEQGRKQYELESTDLVALTRQTVRLMETHAAEKQVNLSLKMDGEPKPVEADGKALQQALVNLIDNALKHSPKGGAVTVGVEFKCGGRSAECGMEEKGRTSNIEHRTSNTEVAESLREIRSAECGGEGPETLNIQHSTFNAEAKKAGTVELWVEDQGPGIPAAEHEKIFERFYRLGSELRRETQGVGIGLSIVKHVVEAHAGKVTVRSAPGQGSRFTIELPAGNGSRK